MNKKRIIISIIVLAILSIGALLLIFNKTNELGNIDNVERIIKSENGHKKEDIEKVFTMIEKKFNTKDYKGCKLKKITYGTYEVNGKSIEEIYKETYNADEVIYLKIEFTTNNRPATGLVANEDYEYKAVYAKINGKWLLKEYGQG